MARQGGRVQLEQSDMWLALNMFKIAKGGFLRAAVDEIQNLTKKRSARVRDEKKQGVEFREHSRVKVVIEKHQALVPENHIDGCLPC